jgi:nitrite reductase/ring-hydroxylating ferredoxin subunit
MPDHATDDQPESSPECETDRRGLLTQTNSLLMAAGLAASYGTFAYMAGKFLYPLESKTRAWVFVCEASSLAKGDSVKFQTPTGERINVARVGDTGSVESFIALSSTCPHLGCQVHWEPKKDRFFCPCHNGTFAPNGIATGGPPGDAGQSLEQKQLKIEQGLLYMFVETERLAAAGIIDEPDHPRGSGHDPCLAPNEPKIG